jgi:hypothetical protein
MDPVDLVVIRSKINDKLCSRSKKDSIKAYISERVSNETGNYIVSHLKDLGFKWRVTIKQKAIKGYISKSEIVENQVGTRMELESCNITEFSLDHVADLDFLLQPNWDIVSKASAGICIANRKFSAVILKKDCIKISFDSVYKYLHISFHINNSSILNTINLSLSAFVQIYDYPYHECNYQQPPHSFQCINQ